MGIGRALLRATIGALFIGHGTQKLLGWFGGSGPEGTAGFFEKLELRPAKGQAIAAGATEAVGGAMLAAGLLTPVASTMLSSVMITAIRKVHGAKGPWNTDGGYEYNIVLIAALFALTEQGPGRYSVERNRISASAWSAARRDSAGLRPGRLGDRDVQDRGRDTRGARGSARRHHGRWPAGPRTDPRRRIVGWAPSSSEAAVCRRRADKLQSRPAGTARGLPHCPTQRHLPPRALN
jgi:putative oxidoreductase